MIHTILYSLNEALFAAIAAVGFALILKGLLYIQPFWQQLAEDADIF